MFPSPFYWVALSFTAAAQAIEKAKPDVLTFVIALVWFHSLIGRFFVDAWHRSRTYYEATDQQAFVVYGAKVRSLRLRDLYTTRLSLARRGRGTISFGAPGFGPSSPGQVPNVIVFDSIENAGSVYELIRPHVPDQ